ncbi:MAG: SRPBCC family protein [Planctomycetota bacterium]
MSTTDAIVQVTRHGKGWVLTASQWLPRSMDEVWPFFADAHNLEELTPPILNFQILTPKPIDMHQGTLIDYRIKIRGIPVNWKTEIERWDPPSADRPDAAFIDNQIKGPYTRWNHLHTFEPKDGGTLCGDRVEYEVPGWFLAPVVNAIAVQKDVEKIFAYRARKMAELFGTPKAGSGAQPDAA